MLVSGVISPLPGPPVEGHLPKLGFGRDKSAGECQVELAVLVRWMKSFRAGSARVWLARLGKDEKNGALQCFCSWRNV